MERKSLLLSRDETLDLSRALHAWVAAVGKSCQEASDRRDADMVDVYEGMWLAATSLTARVDSLRLEFEGEGG